MTISCKNTLEFLRKDFPLAFKSSLLLSIGYLFLIPVIRGISNLDAIHSAGVLGQSLALTGAIILIPITKQELEAGIKEIIYTKPWSYMKTVGTRLICGFLLIAIIISAFGCLMQSNNCIFPFGEYISATILYAVFLGLIGAVFSQAGNSVIIGYFISLGYWSFCQFQIISEKSPAYLFPIINGVVEWERAVILIGMNVLLSGTLICSLFDRQVGRE